MHSASEAGELDVGGAVAGQSCQCALRRLLGPPFESRQDHCIPFPTRLTRQIFSSTPTAVEEWPTDSFHAIDWVYPFDVYVYHDMIGSGVGSTPQGNTSYRMRWRDVGHNLCTGLCHIHDTIRIAQFAIPMLVRRPPVGTVFCQAAASSNRQRRERKERPAW